MTLLYPEVLLLSVLVVGAWWWLSREHGPGFWNRLRAEGAWARLLLPLFGVFILAAPAWVLEDEGADVIIVVDRSRSMNTEGREAAREIIALSEEQRGPGDRVGIVTFGGRSAVERGPEEEGRFKDYLRNIDTEASDLAAGIDTAVELIPSERNARVLVLSDGESTGNDPQRAAARAAARGVAIDYRLLSRKKGQKDFAVADFRLPGEVLPGEAFRFSADIIASVADDARWQLFRDGEVIAKGSGALTRGRNPVEFRDRVWKRGPLRYELLVTTSDDAVPENDRGRGVSRVVGDAGVLHFSHDGQPGNLGRALKASGRPVTTVGPELRPLTYGKLVAYRALVMENVAVGDFRRGELEAIVRFVEEGGGGLLITGGRRSFGLGGYRKSQIEPLLPMTLESKEEQRKTAVALAFVLDRSGSMGATTTDGKTKMQLANMGCIAAMELLNSTDEVSVIAVDSSPHIVVPLTSMAKASGIKTKTAGIESGGGGIYVYVGLIAAGHELSKSERATRQIILFADAADAEEPGKYRELLKKYLAAGIRVSVIALGSKSDRDAQLLQDIANEGEGTCYFATEAGQLPQLFSMEAMKVMRSGFVEEPTGLVIAPELVTLGELRLDALPEIGGYNLGALREGASLGLFTADENRAPILSFWQRGAGRVAAFAAEADGEFSGALANWERYDAYFATLTNWLAGRDDSGSMSARAERQGRQVTVRLELDPDALDDAPSRVPMLSAIADESERPTLKIPFQWEGEHELVARYRLDDGEIRHHSIQVGDRHIRTNPVTLPYSPEFEARQDQLPGEELLLKVASASGGQERLELSGLFDVARAVRRLRSITLPLVILFLILVVLEIAWRRLGFFKQRVQKWTKSAVSRRTRVDGPAPEAALSEPNASQEARAKVDAQDAQLAESRKDALDALREAKRRSRG